MHGQITQPCVITLEQLEITIRSEFFVDYTQKTDKTRLTRKLKLNAKGAIIINGIIDLGEMIAEQLALDIPLFPRKPNVSFNGYSITGNKDMLFEKTSEKTENPFSVLVKLKEKE